MLLVTDTAYGMVSQLIGQAEMLASEGTVGVG